MSLCFNDIYFKIHFFFCCHLYADVPTIKKFALHQGVEERSWWDASLAIHGELLATDPSLAWVFDVICIYKCAYMRVPLFMYTYIYTMYWSVMSMVPGITKAICVCESPFTKTSNQRNLAKNVQVSVSFVFLLYFHCVVIYFPGIIYINDIKSLA